MSDKVNVRGFYRVQITEEGEIVGDSGWRENTVVNDGFNEYLVSTLGAISGSKQVNYAALGTGTAPGATDTTLAGEVEARTAVTAETSSDSKAAQFTATFSSDGSFVTKSEDLQNIGLFASSSGGTIFAGNTYATSSCATNQNVNVSYTIDFS